MITVDFRQILAELEMLSHGSTQSYSATHGGSDESSGFPTGERFPPHIHWRNEWEAAKDDRRRGEVARLAHDELVSYRKRDLARAFPETESEELLEARVIREGTGWTIAETARHCRCTPTFVRRARLKKGVDLVTGEPVDGKTIESDDPYERARTLADRGLSERQIVDLTGIAKSTLRRFLGRAA